MIMMEINRDPQVLSYFQSLHQMPELSWEEVKTSAFIASELEKMGLEVHRNIGNSTAVVGILRGNRPGRVLAMRADMDALPYKDDRGNLIALHTCGHDAHSAMLLAAAKRLCIEGIPCGEIRFVFQPAEEKLGGARLLLESGEVDGVDGIIGQHLRACQELSLHQMTPALRHGASCHVKLRVIGSGAHGAQPHQGVNPIDASALIISGINAIHIDPQIPFSAKVTQICAGSNAPNIIPTQVDMAVDLRAQTNEAMDELREKVRRAAEMGAAAIGARVEIDAGDCVPAAELDDAMTQLLSRAMEGVAEEIIPEVVTSGGEDFHFYRAEGGIPAAFFGLGADLTPGLHKQNMTFNVAALVDGTEVLCRFARAYLPFPAKE